jgi:hypothetical protein
MAKLRRFGRRKPTQSGLCVSRPVFLAPSRRKQGLDGPTVPVRLDHSECVQCAKTILHVYQATAEAGRLTGAVRQVGVESRIPSILLEETN